MVASWGTTSCHTIRLLLFAPNQPRNSHVLSLAAAAAPCWHNPPPLKFSSDTPAAAVQLQPAIESGAFAINQL
ncbi:hypothetical protein OEZ85_000277 [Tetradesmus obliquus]|uniref:Uncharacterized protein n=1 Tax=Tetradesmus obliquus TaxID=3088 RepID=A0ABY8UQ47_TETOB|nr:hypothetical protein OEZ85_000277 [Tetradesmus obliquus]